MQNQQCEGEEEAKAYGKKHPLEVETSNPSPPLHRFILKNGVEVEFKKGIEPDRDGDSN